MLGGSGTATISKIAERTGQHWGRQVVARVPVETLRQINKALGRHFITKYGTKRGIIVLGRVASFGMGAVIGGGANAGLAALAVRAGRRAFGPPRRRGRRRRAALRPRPWTRRGDSVQAPAFRVVRATRVPVRRPAPLPGNPLPGTQ
ncbi:hypothetical protein OHT52_10690 [Streptomyces sp. NBC_00247]|uniref:hypothetical protein n=1 Tax=Streptomyces sp. NBC_00247 TaxID=2975689 RepID=UPI002E286063|nr:hypothetical protein [Streptomyces sp. NBC_00247]